MTSPQSLATFEQCVAAGGRPFEVLEALGGSAARVRFIGMFAHEKTLWNARIQTLEAILQQSLESGNPAPVAIHQYIDIGADGADGRAIDIGLHVPIIDEPTIWKTITMIRNYRRLRLGRIEWGRQPLFPI